MILDDIDSNSWNQGALDCRSGGKQRPAQKAVANGACDAGGRAVGPPAIIPSIAIESAPIPIVQEGAGAGRRHQGEFPAE
jgi:hypothetical protein